MMQIPYRLYCQEELEFIERCVEDYPHAHPPRQYQLRDIGDAMGFELIADPHARKLVEVAGAKLAPRWEPTP